MGSVYFRPGSMIIKSNSIVHANSVLIGPCFTQQRRTESGSRLISILYWVKLRSTWLKSKKYMRAYNVCRKKR